MGHGVSGRKELRRPDPLGCAKPGSSSPSRAPGADPAAFRRDVAEAVEDWYGAVYRIEIGAYSAGAASNRTRHACEQKRTSTPSKAVA